MCLSSTRVLIVNVMIKLEATMTINTDYSTFSNELYKFKKDIKTNYRGANIDFSDLEYKILVLPEKLTYNQVVWIKFNKASTNILKKAFIKAGLRIKNLVKIQELEWDFFNDSHDANIYKEIMSNLK